MLAAAGLSLLLVVACAFGHYEVLRLCNTHLPRLRRIAGRAKVLVAIAAAFCGHLAHIALFAAAYALLHDTSLGGLRGQFQQGAAGFLYFSAETYTSLGFGDVYPAGALRLVAGVEALAGLLMIGWSTSFTYLEMTRHWLAPET